MIQLSKAIRTAAIAVAMATAMATAMAPGFAARASEESVADRLTLSCGQADAVWDAIHAALGSIKHVYQSSLRPRQGETGRTFGLFADGSWYLTFEYTMSLGAHADSDVTCLVAKGGRETAHDALSLIVPALPSATIGGPPAYEKPRAERAPVGPEGEGHEDDQAEPPREFEI